MPRISVCLPTYKNERTIDEAIQSIKNQSFSDYEIVQREDKEKKGLADNLNEIIKLANGEILIFLAGDDVLLPQALENISKEFQENSQLGILTRVYYWFKDDWKKPVRWTKRKNFKIEDLIFLCGQMSGVAVRKSAIETQFQPLTFCEFSSVAIPIIKKWDSEILEKPTVAIRMSLSESRCSWVYNQSPTQNWHNLIKENFFNNEPFVRYMEKIMARNYIGLLQIRMYGGWKKVMKEVLLLLNLDSFIWFHYKFWFYFFVIQFPSGMLKFIRDLML